MESITEHFKENPKSLFVVKTSYKLSDSIFKAYFYGNDEEGYCMIYDNIVVKNIKTYYRVIGEYVAFLINDNRYLLNTLEGTIGVCNNHLKLIELLTEDCKGLLIGAYNLGFITVIKGYKHLKKKHYKQECSLGAFAFPDIYSTKRKRLKGILKVLARYISCDIRLPLAISMQFGDTKITGVVLDTNNKYTTIKTDDDIIVLNNKKMTYYKLDYTGEYLGMSKGLFGYYAVISYNNQIKYLKIGLIVK